MSLSVCIIYHRDHQTVQAAEAWGRRGGGYDGPAAVLHNRLELHQQPS